MKHRVRGVLSAALALSMACSAVAFSACAGGGGQEIYKEDNVVPISIQDDYAADRVVTQGFSLGTPREDAGAFTLPRLVGDNMLLQANVVNKVWGKTSETGDVAAQIIGEGGAAEATYYGAIRDGAFEIYLGAHDYGTGYTVKIVTESGKSVSVGNVAFGELWIGGGQSNMGWTMQQCYRKTTQRLLYQKEIDASENASIRLFRVPQRSKITETENVPYDDILTGAAWQEANPDTVKSFGAAAYFFAKELNAQYGVPVGVVLSCWGGTGIHTWLPESVIGEAVGRYDPNDGNFTDSSCFNGMIYPLRNLTVRGVLWYQGEGDYNSYDVNYGLLMKGWRETFGRDNLWFTTVTLPRYPDADAYFKCREQQMAASKKDPYATYSVNIDCGLLPKDVAEGDTINPLGIHPYDKKPVGVRAAHATMRDLYGAEGVWSGPVFQSAKVSGGKIVITFSNVGKRLVLQGNFGFELADKSAPNTLYNASVRVISGNQIEVYSDQVKHPVRVVYGRANADLETIESYAECVCLYNTKGEDQDIAYPAEQFEWSA